MDTTINAAFPPLFDACPSAVLARIDGVLTDIDDTLTTAGAITPDALDALGALNAARIPVIAVTGRPLGWSLPFARPPAEGGWPIAAIVAENGAVMVRPPGPDRGPGVSGDPGAATIAYAQDDGTRTANARRLADVAARILRDVPGATLARDSAGRVTDIAIDHAEHARLDPPRIDAVVRIMRSAGMNATVSSIHVNGWYGAHTKPSGARWAVRACLGRDLDAERERWLYVGDSTNDQAMFATLPTSVGVANLLDFAATLETWPRYRTRGARGAGFAEVAARLLAVRR